MLVYICMCVHVCFFVCMFVHVLYMCVRGTCAHLQLRRLSPSMSRILSKRLCAVSSEAPLLGWLGTVRVSKDTVGARDVLACPGGSSTSTSLLQGRRPCLCWGQSVQAPGSVFHHPGSSVALGQAQEDCERWRMWQVEGPSFIHLGISEGQSSVKTLGMSLLVTLAS